MDVKISEEVKKNNKIYTEECKEIYDSIKFAKITNKKLYHIVLFCGFCFMFLAWFVGLVVVIIQMKYEKTQGYILALSFLSVGCVLLLTGIIIYLKFLLKKGATYYYINDDNRYIIKCRESDGKLEILSITNYTAESSIYYGTDKSCSIDKECYFTLHEWLGFGQFICPPDQVFDEDIYVKLYYRYKKKKKRWSKVIYYFRPFSHVFGAVRYPRSLTVECGIVKKIAVQNIYYNSDKSNEKSELFIYENVNDDDIKIHIPKIVQDKAKENSFRLPQSSNIIFDE